MDTAPAPFKTTLRSIRHLSFAATIELDRLYDPLNPGESAGGHAPGHDFWHMCLASKSVRLFQISLKGIYFN
jgi:hypothetical protein